MFRRITPKQIGLYSVEERKKTTVDFSIDTESEWRKKPLMKIVPYNDYSNGRSFPFPHRSERQI